MAIESLIRQCGTNKPMGVKLRIYGIPKGDITTFATATGGAGYGDGKVLDNDFALAAGKFWKEYDILVNTAEVINELEGEVGGRAVRNVLPFFIDGHNKEHRQLVDDMVAYDGCMIFLVPEKSGDVSVIGNLDNPTFLEELNGGSGGPDNARRGHQYRLAAATGYSAPIYTGAIATS